MKKLAVLFLLLFSVHQEMAQTSPLVQQVINNVSIDSLTKFVNELSGEVPVTVNGQQVTITSRYYNTTTNDQAADFIKAKFESYGLQAYDQNFSYGRNVYAVQSGTIHPDQYFIICAHYDDMPSNGLAPGADDNGSGTAGVIEAARVLKDYSMDYTVIYAVWDAEELGLLGSAYYASNTSLDILGVINMDMIAWDSDNDNVAEIHTKNVANSLALKDSMLMVNSGYSVGIQPSIINPGIGASDHASFWNHGYSAILLIEDHSGDFNRYYHTSNDLVSHFNLPYFEKCSKLCIGTLATMAKVETTVSLAEMNPNPADGFVLAQNYPNPFNPATTITYSVPRAGKVKLAVYNLIGQVVAVLVNGVVSQGAHVVEFNAKSLPSSVYFYKLQSGNSVTLKKMLLLK